MVELEDLVESFLGNPAHALTEAPFVEGFLLMFGILLVIFSPFQLSLAWQLIIR